MKYSDSPTDAPSPHPRHHPSSAIRIIILALALLPAACSPSGPATTNTKSSAFTTVAERSNFLNEYVTFRRTYESLDFDIMFTNGGDGMLPGPSEWDIRIVATVPASELQEWIPPGVKASPAPDTDWLQSVPTDLDLSGVTEWYVDGRREVGLDRKKRIVVYRSWAY